MPQVSTIISGAASLGVLAGVVSGIFYLVLTGIRWAGRVRAALQEEELRKSAARCASCGRAFAATAARPVVCTVCGKRACFDLPCSRPAPIGWTCVVCHVKRTVESSSGSWSDVKSDEEKTSGSVSDIDGETVQVREFIEKLVEKIVGGPLDGVTVGKLSNHAAYNHIFGKYHEPLCQALARLGFALQLSISSKNETASETPSVAHSALSQLIDKIASEALKLPNLRQPSTPVAKSTPNGTSGLHGKSYEDILSTAILNKVIERYQIQNGYTQDNIDGNRNVMKMECTGVSESLHEDEESDWSDLSRPDPLALKIEEHIEEVTTAYESSSDEPEDELNDLPVQLTKRVPFPEFGVDIVDGSEGNSNSDGESDSCATDVISTQSTWEENWLFQRKKLKSSRNSHHPVPVPMLVPNPSQDFRALIGGVDADDISDLSECSDSVLEEAMSETTEDPGKVLEMIDALNREPVFEDEAQVSQTESNSRSEDPTVASEAHLSEVCDGPSSADTQVSSPDSLEVDEPENSSSSSPGLGQQDRDVPVDYQTVSQIDRPPVPRPRTLEFVAAVEPDAEPDAEPEEKPIICPIAEREKAKWNNAVEMKDNPYTSESIAKRTKNRQLFHLNGSRSSESVDFPVELATYREEPETSQPKYSRDYYVKASRSPTGEPPARFNDSPVSLRSEASLEEPHKIIEAKVELWDDLPPSSQQQPKVSTIGERNSRSAERTFVPEDSTNVNSPTKVTEHKTFLAKKPPIPMRSKSVPATRREPAKEPDVDYSLTPVSQIITNLSNIAKAVPDTSNKQEDIFREVAQIRRERLTKSKEAEVPGPALNSSRLEKETNTMDSTDSSQKKDTPPRARKPIKPVHSLTARSIPKDFREGLKNNTLHTKITKADRVGEIYSARDNSALPPLNFDVKSKKKFWENIAKGKN